MRIRTLCLLALFAPMAGTAARAAAVPPADIYVSPEGRDTWSGRRAEPAGDGSDGPLATLSAARDAVRRLKAARPGRAIRVLIRGGVYRLSEPVVFGPEDSGTAEGPITYAAWPGEKPVFSGGRPIGRWQEGPGRLWSTHVPGVREGRWYFRQLFVNGRRATPARLPLEGFFRSEIGRAHV